MKSILIALLLLFASTTSFAYDCETSYLSSWCANVVRTWSDGNVDAYVPVWTWHNRAQYDSVNLDRYNELPWGIGIGKHYYDKDGDLHRLFTMAFLDSHNKVEPLAGYSYEKIFHPGEDWKLGFGYTAFVTARSDIANYFPFPAVLPLWTVQFGRFSIEQTYVPGGHNNGNVLFTWLRFEL